MPQHLDEYASQWPISSDKWLNGIKELLREAREAGRGLWATTRPAQPITQGTYVGSIQSDKYHYPDCYWAQQIKPENLIWFSSAKEALDMGYVPCKVCDPPDQWLRYCCLSSIPFLLRSSAAPFRNTKWLFVQSWDYPLIRLFLGYWQRHPSYLIVSANVVWLDCRQGAVSCN